jgi:hypothetical protein
MGIEIPYKPPAPFAVSCEASCRTRRSTSSAQATSMAWSASSLMPDIRAFYGGRIAGKLVRAALWSARSSAAAFVADRGEFVLSRCVAK